MHTHKVSTHTQQTLLHQSLCGVVCNSPPFSFCEVALLILSLTTNPFPHPFSNILINLPWSALLALTKKNYIILYILHSTHIRGRGEAFKLFC